MQFLKESRTDHNYWFSVPILGQCLGMRNNQPLQASLTSGTLVTSDGHPIHSASTHAEESTQSIRHRGFLLSRRKSGIALSLTIGLAGVFLIHGAVSGRSVNSAHASVSDTSLLARSAHTAASQSTNAYDSGTKELVARNAKYQANHNDGAGAADSVRWVDRTQSSPLVLIAPHATTQIRDGKRKPADLYTGGITETVADRVGASSLTTTGKVSDWNKDWSTRDDEFKRIIDSLPDNAVIVEIHGMKDSSLDEPVSAGAGDKPSESTDAIVGALQEEFDGHVSQDKFEAESDYTVTDYLQKKGHSVLQIELSRRLRDPKSGHAGQTLDQLTRAFSKAAGQFPQLSTTPEADGEDRLPHLT